MAEIATYKCSNYLCSLTLRLSRNLPVTRDGAFIRLRSDTFCIPCKKVVEYDASHACTECEAEVEVEQLGQPCPRCRQGAFLMPKLSLL